MKKVFYLYISIALLACGCTSTRPEKIHAGEQLAIANVFEAVQALEDTARVSDLVKAPVLSDTNDVYLKLETQQPTGAFKLRGAYYMISKLTEAEKKRGVVTCSTGNHAQGVGYAAAKFGVKATIFLPSSTPEFKIKAIRTYKAEIKLVDGVFDDALAAAVDFQKRTNAVYIPPFDNYDIIAGQGTIGWEILHQLPEADIIVVPIGGGGLISGIAFAAKTLKPSCKIYGVEPEGAASMLFSRKTGKLTALHTINTIADGTAVKRPGQITFELCNRYVDEIVTVDEAQIKDAIRRLYNDYHVTAEGAGALSAAAVLNGKIPGKGKKVVCVISGGNIDHSKLEEILKQPE